MTIESTQEFFQIRGGTLWDGRTLYDLYREAYMPWDWQPKLKSYADELQIDLFSSGFDATAVDFLEDMGVPAHKVASLEIVDIPLVEKMASTHKPLIISTGAATLREIEEAVSAAQSRGAAGIALLKCTSAYPAPPAEMNLRTLAHLWETFGLPVGVSDHTLGAVVPIVAVALGACIVEKHFTLSRTHPGPDSAFSLEPHEFKAMVEAIRVAEKAVGDVNYGVTREERKCSDYRRSLFVVKDIKAGEMFTEENVRSIRPGGGLLPKYVQDVIGKKANQNLERGTPLRWDHIAKS
jgi:N-acetylneuraminate synthase